MKSSVKLTMKDARSVVNQVFPSVKLEREITAPDVMIFRGTTGPDGLEIAVQNDWLNRDGKIHMTITEPMGGRLERVFEPHTLQRDLEAEDKIKRDKAKQARVEWVCSVGPEMAHRLVDKYWEAGKE